MSGGEYANREAEFRADATRATGQQRQTNDLEVLRVRRMQWHDAKRQAEKEVERDIAERRKEFRQNEARRFHDVFVPPPRKSDMTFWKTRIGEPLTIQTPEEQKAKRTKTIKHHKMELNRFRCHALEGFIYWHYEDSTVLLSGRVS